LYYLPVALVTVFKSLTNIFIMLGDWYLYGEKPSKMLVSSAVMIVLGAVLTGYNDLAFNLTGYIWMGLNCAATLGYVLYMRKLSMLKMTKHGMTYHNLTLAAPISTLMAFNELPLFFGAEDRWTDFGFVFWAVMSGALGFIMAFASFWCMSVTSATTYCMVGALNKVPLAILGVWMFSEPVTWRLSLYIAIGLLGGILFSLSQTLEKEAKKQEPVKPESAKSPV
ncbi:VRG4, partial [Symbiodinium sp. KB8]